MFMLLAATWGWKSHVAGKPKFLTEFEEWIDYDNPPPSKYSLEAMKEAQLFYGVGLNDVDWTGERYYINGPIKDYYDSMWKEIDIMAAHETEWYRNEAVNVSWSQWTPISHCLFLGNNRSRIEKLPFEEDRAVNELNGGAQQDYKKRLRMWSDAERWLGLDTFEVPESWPTVDELERRNSEGNATWLAQLRVRFCNDRVPLEGRKLCRGDNGVFERKVFYFQQKSLKYYEEKLREKLNLWNLTTTVEGGNWCTPTDVSWWHDVDQRDSRWYLTKSIVRHNGRAEMVDEIEQLKRESSRLRKNLQKIKNKRHQNYRTYVKKKDEAWMRYFDAQYNRVENYTSEVLYAETDKLYEIFKEEKAKLVARKIKNVNLKQETTKQLVELARKRDELVATVMPYMDSLRRASMWKELDPSYYDLPF